MLLRACACAVRCRLHYPVGPFSSSLAPYNNSSMSTGSIRIAVVGDVHGDWDLEEDSKALRHIQPDLVLFTGDFGNENIEIVRSIANLDMPKAAILGNHDCWYTYDIAKRKSDRLQIQLELFGAEHVGYRCLDFPRHKLSVIGGRPFSRGGDTLFRPRLLSAIYDVKSMEESAKKIMEAVVQKPEEHFMVLLAHNGPTGLGSEMNDICGRDWVFGGGDHGDRDLADAISNLRRRTGIPIPLVVFGHMHKDLAYGGLRKMLVVGPDGTFYLNGAIVPRVKYNPVAQSARSSSGRDQNELIAPDRSTMRAFTIVDMLEGRVEKISEVWVLLSPDVTAVAEEIVLYRNQQTRL